MTPSQQILQYLVSGITNGSVYALIALGFVTIYSVTGIINFAQGEFVMLGALITVSLFQAGLPLLGASLLSILTVAVLASLLQWTAIRPAKGASILTLIIITIGAALTLRGIALVIWGTFPYALPPFTEGPPWRPFGIMVRLQSLWVLGTTLALQPLLHLFFHHTLVGKSLRACAINPFAARLMGIDTQRMGLFSFAFSGALAALGGILITPIILATYDMGLMLALKGFVAAAMGGLGNYPIAVAGGFLLGILESLGAGLISSGYKDAIAFFILFLILLSRPHWIFRKEETSEGEA